MSRHRGESNDTYTKQANQPRPAENLRIYIKINGNWKTRRANEDICRPLACLGEGMRIFSCHVQLGCVDKGGQLRVELEVDRRARTLTSCSGPNGPVAGRLRLLSGPLLLAISSRRRDIYPMATARPSHTHTPRTHLLQVKIRCHRNH